MHPLAHLEETDIVLDALPSEVAASIEVRDKYMNGLSMGGGMGLEFVVSDVQRWLPGQVVRVAFLDGDDDLHRAIMEATQEISDACNLKLDFGETDCGSFRRWTEQDNSYAAEIRVSFDKGGYFSLVGTDSIDGTLGSPNGDVGGRPYQASLNLGGYAVKRPSTWRGTTRHEFLHALGFHHAHQNMRGPCQASFRWDDDDGYQPTKNDRGGFIADAAGRRPGIYTYLAGYPNFWDRMKVDHNLKTEEDPHLVAGPFDPQSVMLYRFPPDFYKSVPSPCAPQGDGQELSDGDKRGLQLLYPQTATEVAAVVSNQQEIFSAVAGFVASEPEAAGLETAIRPMGQIGGVADVLRRKLDALK
ncbi:hypothetical protein [Roseovarius sp. M141]|uniref:hypothetical protein n=1 Tax=Roseovarius sp. M141 TaxID=2583806 RepID=UPI0020CF556E|nr:hypothetical protein [Roseovarius sp. M141]MCQ0092536.1 hypothetical protein [Roseovarius sp. M141]